VKKLLLLFLIAFAACNAPNKQQIVSDSLQTTKKITSTKTKNKADSLEKKVIGNINFGISENEFNRLYTDFLMSRKCTDGCYIGGFEYNKAYPNFYHDQLQSLKLVSTVSLMSYSIVASDIVTKATEVVSAQYGNANITNHLPKTLKKEYDYAVINQWNVGDKEIVVYVERKKYEYWIDLCFTSKKLQNASNKEFNDYQKKHSAADKDVL